MFDLMILFGMIAAAAHFLATREARRHDEIVASRRWETSVSYPETALVDWVASGTSFVEGYARVLLPYDFILLFSLGAALACGSLAAADSLNWQGGVKLLLAVAPLAFTVADFSEDRLLLRLLAARAATPAEVRRLKALTLAKFVALAAALAQTAALGLWAWLAG